jgi:23S rRNA pseudouridine2605 synthase
MDVRVQKILSQWGVASRRQAEQMILDGRVQLNGALAKLGQKADPILDRIQVDGVIVKPENRPEFIYLLLNKPIGVVSTCYDAWGRQTVLDLLPPELRKGYGIHPVGRLDSDSTGALLLTNDGSLTFQLTHPRHQIAKTYQVWVEGEPSEAILSQWRQGIMLADRKTLPAQVIIVDCDHRHNALLQIVLREGRNRQIRRVAAQLGHPLIHLHRTAIGPIQLKLSDESELMPGCYRPLNDQEVHLLQSQIVLPSVRVPVEREEYSL